MHQLIHVYYQDILAGIFDHNTRMEMGRFEWLPTFKKEFASFVDAFDAPEHGSLYSFNPTIELPRIFFDQMPGLFQEQLLQSTLMRENENSKHRSPVAWISLAGNRGLGAFRFEPFGLPELNEQTSIDIDQLVISLKSLFENTSQKIPVKHLRNVLRTGLFAHGDSPKALLSINDFTGEVLSGQGSNPDDFQAWILKLDGIIPTSKSKIPDEFSYYQAAKACGLRVASTRTMKDGSLTHLLVKRFDRSGHLKIAYVSYGVWCATAGNYWESVFRKMRQLRMSFVEMEELYKRLVFYYLTNQENIDIATLCFLFSKEEGWCLTPAFNLKPTKKAKNQTIQYLDDSETKMTKETLLQFGKKLNLRKSVTYFSEIEKKLIDFKQSHNSITKL